MTPLTCVAAAIAVLAAIGSGSVQPPLGIPTAYVDVLKSWDNFIVGLWAIVLPFILHKSDGEAPIAPVSEHKV